MGILNDISAFSNPYGTPSKGQWNITKGIYIDTVTGDSCIFYYETKSGEAPGQLTSLETITDSGSRRLAIYEYPYLPGQRIADLGRKGETYVFNLKFIGANYQTLFNKFLTIVVNSPNQGVLVHPIRGSLIVKFADWEFVHRHDEFSAVTIKATFKEDNTNALTQINVPAASPDSALRSALQTMTNSQAAITAALFQVGALLKLPGAIVAAMNARLSSLTN